MKMLFYVGLSLSLGLTACVPPSTPAGPSPSASPALAASASPNPSPSSGPSSGLGAVAGANPSAAPTPTVSLNPSQPVAVAPGKPAQDLSLLKSLTVLASKVYLDKKGEVVNLQPVLKDAAGQPLNTVDFPLEWLSSRPADFAVDASGKVTALVEYGYSEITLRVPGTDLAVKQLLSVTELVGTSSGGSGSVGPTQENVNGTIEFQF